MELQDLKPGVVVLGLLSEPCVLDAVAPVSSAVVRIVATGRESGATVQRVLHLGQIAKLQSARTGEHFHGDASRFRLGVEALRLGLAHEYDPYFSLSIARIDPLPHQLEAVYEHFLRLPRIRFLLADDPGAGKTVMAGLLLKELKIRGLVERVLIVAPANLMFQWQREMQDKFRERFDVVKGDTLRGSYGSNPFTEHHQVVTSISWISRIEDARDSLLRARWDLVIVDEAHKMAAYSADKKTLAYKVGEQLRDLTDHYLLMTATPHKGDPDNFCLFLQLLDEDVYGSVKSLEEAMRRNRAPFYLRRTKEALVTFPDPHTGACKKLYPPRHVSTVAFQLSPEEMGFYEDLTRYVEEQSIRVADDNSPRGRAVGFTMAMLQRRQASSVYAVRCTLERMRARRQEILDDPEAWKREQIEKRLAAVSDEESMAELEDDEQDRIIRELERIVTAADPKALKKDIAELDALIARARAIESAGVEVKLKNLREVLRQHGIPNNPAARLLIFTEHKDTLDYLCGDGKEGRPLGKLTEWGVSTTQIHGAMKVGDRNTPNTRIYAEVDFHDRAQVMVATEAAGEGINLQFCWLMVNYDIPWNPVRLEQRMGRIHRYGQEHDCYVFNFVSSNTREGRVLQKLFDRLDAIRNDLHSDQVFDVVGEVVPGNLLEGLFRRMYARQIDEAQVVEHLLRDVDVERFQRITRSTLEGLARRNLNLSMLVERDTMAKAKRLVPETVRDFFLEGSALIGMQPRAVPSDGRVFRLGRVAREVAAAGRALEARWGILGQTYEHITFHKDALGAKGAPNPEWVTPGHPLFEALREVVRARTDADLARGATFYDVNAVAPSTLDVYEGTVVDSRDHVLGRRLFLVRTGPDGDFSLHDPALLLDLAPAPPAASTGVATPEVPDGAREAFFFEHAMLPYLDEIERWRTRELDTIASHVTEAMTDLLDRSNRRLADLVDRQVNGTSGLEPHIDAEEKRIDELAERFRSRLGELDAERNIQIQGHRHLGRALVLPHPGRTATAAMMVRDAEIERIAIETVTAHERAQGRVVESVEADNRGFDLISRLPHPTRAGEFTDARFIEVKGRSAIGDVALTPNEYKTAERLRGDYWLYVVYQCATSPELHAVRDPVRLGWRPVQEVARYQTGSEDILGGQTK